ncbi:putative transcription regulator mTERF family [Rosa chinensis]|uniref:Putative transcription regulator mTERF family n=2 Tax=Rosa chinensis TaxID=74649 RepID=A0A2P6RYC1_ROSCH|nr:putative transcription regulator mTERF family [Rosa chinensis]
MVLICCKRLQLLVPSCRIAVDYSVTHLQKALPFTRLYSSKPLLGVQDDKARSFTVSYLINSFGFSPQLALSASNKMKVRFDTPEKPDSVIKLFKDYGLSDAHISDIVKKCPVLLVSNAEKTLWPKLQFFTSIGLSGNDLARIFRVNANILTLSLERSIRPCHDIMKTLEIPEHKVPYFISNYYMFNPKVLSNVPHNTLILRAHQVPEASFPLWVCSHLLALSFDSEKVKTNVEKVINMGFDPSSTTFMKALYVVSVTNAAKWKHKMEFYEKWGWTEDDVLLAFRKNPMFMSFSVKNISAKMDFLLNKMGFQPADLAARPDILTYSLEKRIIPRCSVIRFLQLKGLIVKEDLYIISIVHKNEKWFLERFVIKYEEQAPELQSILQGKMGLAEFGLGFDESG